METGRQNRTLNGLERASAAGKVQGLLVGNGPGRHALHLANLIQLGDDLGIHLRSPGLSASRDFKVISQEGSRLFSDATGHWCPGALGSTQLC